jgi:glycosyltransferase involved in cell wall biosynthesis
VDVAGIDEAADGDRICVLTLIDRPIVSGGGERMASTIAAGLDPDRFERVLCSTRPNDLPTRRAQLEAAGVEVFFLDRHSKLSLRAWAPLIRLLRSGRVDVLHAHKFGSNLWGAILGRITRVPVVVAHEHSWSYEGQPLRRFLDREVIARWSDAFVAVSREDRRRMIEVEGIDADRIRFIPNGIPALGPVTGDVRQELGIPGDGLLVGAVGQLREEKAFDVLIRAAAVLADRYPALRVVIAGDGPDAGRLADLIGELGLEGVVTLLGTRTDIPDVLDALDVAVCCSVREGSPLSVMEYMAAGKPVVASRVGGVPDLIDEGVHGLLVDARDPEGFAEAIGRLLDDPDRRRRMGVAARQRQQADFELDTMIRTIEGLYEELLEKGPRRRRRRSELRA